MQPGGTQVNIGLLNFEDLILEWTSETSGLARMEV